MGLVLPNGLGRRISSAMEVGSGSLLVGNGVE